MFSQFSEHTILDALIKKLDPVPVCCEFGAWDGLLFSNTAHLRIRGWLSINIEFDPDRFDELEKNTELYDCINVCRAVGRDIDFLREYGIKEIGVLSIDVDGNDCYILENLSYRPEIIIVEFNPSIPSDTDMYQDYIQPGRPEKCFGCSIKTIERIAKKKGYKVVRNTKVNAFLVPENADIKRNISYDEYVVDGLIATHDKKYIQLKKNVNLRNTKKLCWGVAAVPYDGIINIEKDRWPDLELYHQVKRIVP
jgi:hypothetical protein